MTITDLAVATHIQLGIAREPDCDSHQPYVAKQTQPVIDHACLYTIAIIYAQCYIVKVMVTIIHFLMLQDGTM